MQTALAGQCGPRSPGLGPLAGQARLSGRRSHRDLQGLSFDDYCNKIAVTVNERQQGTSLHVRKSLISVYKGDLGVNISLI